MTAATTAVVVSLSGGALLANLVSVTILVVDLPPGSMVTACRERGHVRKAATDGLT
jgi:hypothetical protein